MTLVVYWAFEVAVVLILLHSPDGHRILLDPDDITSMRGSIEGKKNEVLDERVHCVINTSDGKFLSVVETCEEVQHRIKDLQK